MGRFSSVATQWKYIAASLLLTTAACSGDKDISPPPIEQSNSVNAANSFAGENNPYQGWVKFQTTCGKIHGHHYAVGKITAEVSLNNGERKFEDTFNYHIESSGELLSSETVKKSPDLTNKAWLREFVKSDIKRFCSLDGTINYAAIGATQQRALTEQSNQFAEYLLPLRAKYLPKESGASVSGDSRIVHGVAGFTHG